MAAPYRLGCALSRLRFASGLHSQPLMLPSGMHGPCQLLSAHPKPAEERRTNRLEGVLHFGWTLEVTQ